MTSRRHVRFRYSVSRAGYTVRRRAHIFRLGQSLSKMFGKFGKGIPTHLAVMFGIFGFLLAFMTQDQLGAVFHSGRWANGKEMQTLSQLNDGLLIGRDPTTNVLLRYDGPAHLTTIAPTRAGKGVGTIIPNLLSAQRSVICINPKGEKAKIIMRARQRFRPVHVLDPFAVTGKRPAAFNPLDMLDPAGFDLSGDASTLADALVFDEPGMSGDAHC